MATALFLILAVYLTLGVLFAVIFLVAGLKVIDPSAQGAGYGFKLIILPGIIALWPILAKKWISTR